MYGPVCVCVGLRYLGMWDDQNTSLVWALLRIAGLMYRNFWESNEVDRQAGSNPPVP